MMTLPIIVTWRLIFNGMPFYFRTNNAVKCHLLVISLKYHFMHITFSLIIAGTEVLCQKLCYFLSSSWHLLFGMSSSHFLKLNWARIGRMNLPSSVEYAMCLTPDSQTLWGFVEYISLDANDCTKTFRTCPNIIVNFWKSALLAYSEINYAAEKTKNHCVTNVLLNAFFFFITWRVYLISALFMTLAGQWVYDDAIK